MEAVLDTSFIVSCMKRKIDFIGRLEEEGFKILLPKEVFEELKDLRLNVKHDERVAVDLALALLNTKKVKRTTLGQTTVDAGLIALGKKGAYIATLDTTIKRSVPNRVVINSAQNKISIERS